MLPVRMCRAKTSSSSSSSPSTCCSIPARASGMQRLRRRHAQTCSYSSTSKARRGSYLPTPTPALTP